MGFGGGSTGLSTPISFGVEQSSGPKYADDLDLALIGRHYFIFTLPAGTLYKITGIEWKNGAAVAGNVICGISEVDADPFVNTHVPLRHLARRIPQAGVNAVQRNTFDGPMFKGGTILMAWFQTDAGGLFRKHTLGPNEGSYLAVAYTVTPPTAENVAAALSTDNWYCKVYYQQLNG